jgi:hypothetical protein
MGLRLFFLLNFPGATFIQGGTFIPNSRVLVQANLNLRKMIVTPKGQLISKANFKVII